MIVMDWTDLDQIGTIVALHHIATNKICSAEFEIVLNQPFERRNCRVRLNRFSLVKAMSVQLNSH